MYDSPTSVNSGCHDVCVLVVPTLCPTMLLLAALAAKEVADEEAEVVSVLEALAGSSRKIQNSLIVAFQKQYQGVSPIWSGFASQGVARPNISLSVTSLFEFGLRA